MTKKDIELLQKLYEENDPQENKFQQIEIGLGRGWNPSINHLSNLQNMSKEGIDELINHLNMIGEEDEQNWVLKDNLIRHLFSAVKEPNI